MTQNDNALELATAQDSEREKLDRFHVLATFERVGESLISESTCAAEEIYRTDNFVPDDLYELLRNWDLAYLKQQELHRSVGSMDNGSHSSENVYDPIRCMSDFAPPPKLFYPTIWRSVTRKVIQREKNGSDNTSSLSGCN